MQTAVRTFHYLDGFTPRGVHRVFRASLATIPPALESARRAQSGRSQCIGTISDTFGSRKPYIDAARRALEVADIVCFVGSQAFLALRAASADGDDRLRAFGIVRAASDFLNAILRSGDLVLLKGSNTAEHIGRVLLSRTTPVTCWRMDCGRHMLCDTCELLATPSSPPEVYHRSVLPDEPVAIGEGDALSFNAATSGGVLIGLGNPSDACRGTPHNVGHDVLIASPVRSTPGGGASQKVR